jgi:hypothetical protein
MVCRRRASKPPTRRCVLYKTFLECKALQEGHWVKTHALILPPSNIYIHKGQSPHSV